MYQKATYYLSTLVGKRVFGPDGQAVGKVSDLVVDIGPARPRVVAAVLSDQRAIDFSSCRIEKEGRRILVRAKAVKDAEAQRDDLLFLKRHLLDRQIVDVDGRKLVRVNDLVIDSVAAGTFLVAVDVGIEGLFRRLGVDRPVAALLSLFRKGIPSKLILWKEVEAVDFPRLSIKLSSAYQKLSTFHPSDLADILEDLDRNSQLALFTSLDEERAADVMEELEPDAQVQILESMPVEKAADVLEKMPADEVADILDELKREKAESLLSEMEGQSSSEVRTLMEYPENAVGSLMSTDFLGFREADTVDKVLSRLRETKPEAEEIYQLYVLDSKGRYKATVHLRDIVVSDPAEAVSSIMDANLEALVDTDDVYSIADVLLKYKLHALPVVDADGVMVGTIVIEDVLEHVMSLRRRK